MNLQKHAPGTALTEDTCRQHLLHSRHGFLACTSRALPTVVPAELSWREGRLLVKVHDPALTDQLVGQVVALGIGERTRPFRRGWRVMARGQLGAPDQSDGSALPLEPYQVEGVTEGRQRVGAGVAPGQRPAKPAAQR